MPSVRVDGLGLKRFTIQVFEQVGLSRDDAVCISENLVEADLRGVHSHGVQNLPRYAQGYLRGFVNKHTDCPVVIDAGGVSVIDGQNGLGIVTCNRAMDIAIERARSHGIAMVGVRNSNHFGAAAFFTMKALAHDQIGFCTTNGPAVMAPWGGKDALLSNNPFSYAIPAGAEPPIVLDMACCVAARGRIRLKARAGEPIPDGWALTSDGEPTTDALKALDGTVQPVGGYKGYGIAVVNEVLAAALTGARFSYQVSQGMLGAASELGDFVQHSWLCGHWVGAFDIGKLVPIAEFKQRVDELSRTLKDSPKAKGSERICLPGGIEHELRTERMVSGLPLDRKVLENLNTLAREVGVAAVEPLSN